jgi:hypothetical protein
MTKYLLAIYQPEGNGDVPPREVLDEVMRKVGEIRDDMKSSGVWVFSGGLDSPHTTTVVRKRHRDVLATDGPFVESKEHIGGLTIIEVQNRDAALAWARKLAEAIGLPIEVRAFIEQHTC